MNLISLIITSKPEFQRSVDKILNSVEYSHLKNDTRSFIERIREAIARKILEFFQKNLSGIKLSSNASETLPNIFMIIGVLVLIVLIVLIVLKTNKALSKKRRIKEILGEKIDEATTPVTLRQKAAQFKEKGDLRQAIRFDFISMLLLLHESSILYLDETKTNEEIYKYLKREKFFMLEDIKYLMNIFNSTWYGNKVCTEDMYKEWNYKIDLLWNEVIKLEEKAK